LETGFAACLDYGLKRLLPGPLIWFATADDESDNKQQGYWFSAAIKVTFVDLPEKCRLNFL